MSKITVLYWEPGSCGDFVQNLILSRPDEYQGIVKSFCYDATGRTAPQDIISFIKENFNCINNLWYEIDWNESNLDKLTQYIKQNNIKQFLIPTHRLEQVVQIKQKMTGSVTVGLTYPKNMFPLVLKNWCKKVSANDQVLQEIYNKPLHKNLSENGLFGEYIMREQLKFGTKIPNEVNECFDVNISLESIFAKDLTNIKSLFKDPGHVDDMFNGWFNHQNELHKYHHELTGLLGDSLGFNRLATQYSKHDIELDMFDNILINHYTSSKKQLPIFKTLTQAQIFFKDCAME